MAASSSRTVTGFFSPSESRWLVLISCLAYTECNAHRGRSLLTSTSMWVVGIPLIAMALRPSIVLIPRPHGDAASACYTHRLLHFSMPALCRMGPSTLSSGVNHGDHFNMKKQRLFHREESYISASYGQESTVCILTSSKFVSHPAPSPCPLEEQHYKLLPGAEGLLSLCDRHRLVFGEELCVLTQPSS